MKTPSKRFIAILGGILIFSFILCVFHNGNRLIESWSEAPKGAAKKNGDYIKWVDFKVTKDALQDAYTYDVKSHTEEAGTMDWISLLAYLGARYGGDFSKYKKADMSQLVEKLNTKGETMENLTKDMKYYSYYYEAYNCVLGGLVGEYEVEVPADTSDGSTGETPTDEPSAGGAPADNSSTWVKKYGLKGFHPIAKGFPYDSYDDFGTSRSYGYKRNHLGNDLLGQVGTPIIAVEAGYIEAMGWNQYGGWRIGIRSFDKKRYYYYAHMRKDFPYCKSLKEGDKVEAGQVIGYMGRTGYSATQNVNNIQISHLHFGLQLIFDESQKEGNNEIWVDCYELIQFLRQNQSLTARDDATKEWSRVYGVKTGKL